MFFYSGFRDGDKMECSGSGKFLFVLFLSWEFEVFFFV